MREDGKLDYLELPGGDLPASKDFYGAAFGWKFIDYGPEYAAFDEGLDGGFDAQADAVRMPLPVLFATDFAGLPCRPPPRNLRIGRICRSRAMIVLMAGGAALTLLMREERASSQNLAPAQMGQGGQHHRQAQSEPQPQRRVHPPRLGRQHVHRHLPREEDALFR